MANNDFFVLREWNWAGEIFEFIFLICHMILSHTYNKPRRLLQMKPLLRLEDFAVYIYYGMLDIQRAFFVPAGSNPKCKFLIHLFEYD